MIECTEYIITYIWQSQAPVSLNTYLTIKGLLKKCISEEVPCGFFLRTVIVNRGNSCELKAKKKVLVLHQWADFFPFSKLRNVQTQNKILKFLLLLANIGCWNCLAMVNIIISIFSLLVFLKQLIYLSLFLDIHFFFWFRKKRPPTSFSEVNIWIIYEIIYE